MVTSGDSIDQLIQDWQAIHPELETAPLEVVGRVIVLGKLLEKSVNSALAKHGLSLGQFDILATLRRADSEAGLSPSELLRGVMLTSGGMTSRLDRLAEMGLVNRKGDRDDRRGVNVSLTAKGRKLIDAATQTRFEEAETSLCDLPDSDRLGLSRLLRKWLSQLDHHTA